MSNNKSYKIIVVDPSKIVTTGLNRLLDTNNQFNIIEQLDNTTYLRERLLVSRPDILIINPMVIDFGKQFSVRSMFQEFPDLVLIALVYSHVRSEILRQYTGVIEISDDKHTIETTLNTSVSLRSEKKETTENQGLTDREIDVLVAVAQGLMNKEIADKLNISIHTVISHRKNISRKTGIKSVSGLAIYALLNNLISKDKI